MNTVCIVEQPLEVKEWQGQRVITFKDVDQVHQRPGGTASRNFKSNRKHFIANVDYFQITRKEFGTKFVPNSKLEGNPNLTVILLTESGYLMLAKSLTDDLAWDVQRALVNNYFRGRQPVQQQLPIDAPMPVRKTFRGVPVMTTKDVAQVMHCRQTDARYWATQCNPCGRVLEEDDLDVFKRENGIRSTASKMVVLYRYQVEDILEMAGASEDMLSAVNVYFGQASHLEREDMRCAVMQADLLYKIAKNIKDPVVKEMNLKAVTALLIDVGLWNNKESGFNGVTANWDINTREGWNKLTTLQEAKKCWL